MALKVYYNKTVGHFARDQYFSIHLYTSVRRYTEKIYPTILLLNILNT